ncbi:hypothetical protein HZ326_13861 [Fusarium oxysporum f. sp. albedinis]|nr:hypothetical protein HZ326_13861 [Fusarium oxysporum f. sp. albedinis]
MLYAETNRTNSTWWLWICVVSHKSSGCEQSANDTCTARLRMYPSSMKSLTSKQFNISSPLLTKLRNFAISS